MSVENDIKRVTEGLRKHLGAQFTGCKNTVETRQAIETIAQGFLEHHVGHLPEHQRIRLGEVKVSPDGHIRTTIILPQPIDFQVQETSTHTEALEDLPEDNLRCVEIICRPPEVDWGWSG